MQEKYIFECAKNEKKLNISKSKYDLKIKRTSKVKIHKVRCIKV